MCCRLFPFSRTLHPHYPQKMKDFILPLWPTPQTPVLPPECSKQSMGKLSFCPGLPPFSVCYSGPMPTSVFSSKVPLLKENLILSAHCKVLVLLGTKLLADISSFQESFLPPWSFIYLVIIFIAFCQL